MDSADKKLRQEDSGSNSIFGDIGSGKENQSLNYAGQLQQKRFAEDERLKGNEFMKSKEYQDAVNCYTKSLDIMQEAATYSNRAMAYLKLKNYNQVVDDANAALKIDSKYLKAYHRRGKAYFELRKYEQAIKDFQYILEREPDNKDINQSLMDARYRLNNPGSEPEDRKAPSKP